MNAQRGENASRSHASAIVCADLVEGEQTEKLLQALKQKFASGQDVLVDASAVTRVSTLALQVFAAAKKSALGRSIGFEILNPSAEFCRACRDTGLHTHLAIGN